MGDFKVGVNTSVYCTLSTGVNTNFEITQYVLFLEARLDVTNDKQ
jgi:hypothetical protein